VTAIIEAFLKFFSEFSWRRLIAVIVVALLIGLGFILYERYTSGFRLGRLQKQAELLVTLNQLQSGNIRSDPRLGRIYDRLVADADSAAQAKPLSITFFSFPSGLFSHALAKFLAGAAPWALVGLFFIRGILRGDKTAGSAFLGILVFIVLFGVIGAALPTWWWPWFNLWIYPIGHFIIFLAAVVFYAARSTKKRSKLPVTQEGSQAMRST
jgi:hypothetical protein